MRGGSPAAARVLIQFESGPIAQRLEQGTHNPLVPGSNPGGPMLLLGLEFSHLLQRGARRGLLLLELVLLSGLIIATRDAKHADVFVNGQVYFVDADCYSRMTRAREVWEHPGLVVRQ